MQTLRGPVLRGSERGFLGWGKVDGVGFKGGRAQKTQTRSTRKKQANLENKSTTKLGEIDRGAFLSSQG